MDISVKTKISIQTQLEKIKNDSFKEEDIKLLLIDIREDIREESLLRELADFIAHPRRDKGIFNKMLNSRYLKFKLINEQKEKLNEEQRIKLGTDIQLSEFLLGAINIEKVEKLLFEILFVDGLDDIDEKLFNIYYPISKKCVRKLISENYQLDFHKKFYILKSQKDFPRLDDALKFIRGTIQAKPVFNQITFEKEILKAITRIINLLNLDISYSISVKKHKKSILLCILCLLHDAKFIFHDNHIGTCFLSLYPSDAKLLNAQADKDSFIALIATDMQVTMPIFVSNIKVDECTSFDEKELVKFGFMQRIPWINAARTKDNKLVLIA